VPVSLYRDKYPEAFRALRLASRREIAPDFWRVRLTVGDGEGVADALAGYRAPGAGDHGRVYVGRAADDWAVPTDAAGVPTGEFRIETVVDYSVDEGWIDLDLLVHRGADGSPAGLIGPWAVAAPLGSPVIVADPKGSVLMRGAPAAWVLAGDDSAVPAVRRYLAALEALGVSGLVLLETRYEVGELELDVPAGVEVRILQPGARPSSALADALAALPRPLPAPDGAEADADVLLFACAEQSLVPVARRVLKRWIIDPDHAVAKGYWKRGASA
jgi:NADPH-dependent ferric siderophore reductase